MAVNKVEIYVSQILEDLNNGLTWLKRDDLGYGSIQDKYNAKDQQIAMIRKHPVLKDAETTVTVFTVIDDTKEDYNGGTTTVSATERTDEQPMESLLVTEAVNTGSESTSSIQSISYQSSTQRDEQVTADDLSAFANL
jgi:hypothetical protein